MTNLVTKYFLPTTAVKSFTIFLNTHYKTDVLFTGFNRLEF